MKDPLDVLRTKEQELLKVKREIEALRITVSLLGEDGPAAATQISANLVSANQRSANQKVEQRQLVEMP